MKSVVYRDGKAPLIVGISFTATMLVLLWTLVSIVRSESIPPWVWALVATIGGLLLFPMGVFVAMLIGEKSIVSERSLTKVVFKRKRELLKENILLIAEERLGKGEWFYVVYPKGYEPELFDKHKSFSTSILERTKMVQRDKRLLVFSKTKRMSEILNRFGYIATAIIE